jgi:hypothetical protein
LQPSADLRSPPNCAVLLADGDVARMGRFIDNACTTAVSVGSQGDKAAETFVYRRITPPQPGLANAPRGRDRSQ